MLHVLRSLLHDLPETQKLKSWPHLRPNYAAIDIVGLLPLLKQSLSHSGRLQPVHGVLVLAHSVQSAEDASSVSADLVAEVSSGGERKGATMFANMMSAEFLPS